MTRSKAAVFSGEAEKLAIQEFSRPCPAEGEILVRVLGCTLCGSDLHTVSGRRQAPVPTVLGHEIVGEIVEFGNHEPPRDMSGHPLQLGDRVSWSIVANCGECFFCQHNLPQKCLRSVKYGHEAFRPGRELLGGLAEHCLLVKGTYLVRLPSDLPLEVACPANCATATAMAAIESAGDLRGTTVCVLGAGLLGLTACAIARIHGARTVICVELQVKRRERALHFGATHAVEPSELAIAVEKIPDSQGVDVAFEMTGSPAAFTTVWPTLRIGGTLIVVGAVFPAPPVELKLEQLVRRHLVLRGIHNYAPRHLLQAIQFLDQHHRSFPFAELVAQWHSLSEIDTAFHSAHDPDKIRVGVRP